MEHDKNRNTDKEKRKRLLLIPLHILAVIGIAFLIVALIRAQHQITQITMIPTPGTVESLPQESLPLANVTPSPVPTPSGETETPTAVMTPTLPPTPSPTATATTAATPRPTTTARPTVTSQPSTSPSTSPSASASMSPSQTAEPSESTPAFTYSVSNDDGVAPAGYTIVMVRVNPGGGNYYRVTYDGQVMNYRSSSDIYYLTVPKLDDGGYRSHVHVSQN